jgi:hypothetical protein
MGNLLQHLEDLSYYGNQIEERGYKEGLSEARTKTLQFIVSALHTEGIPLERIYAIVKAQADYSYFTKEQFLDEIHQWLEERGHKNGLSEARAETLQFIVSTLYSEGIPLEQIYANVKKQPDYYAVTEEEIRSLYEAAQECAYRKERDKSLRGLVSALYSFNIPLEQIFVQVKEQEFYADATEEEIRSLYEAAMQANKKNGI